MESIDSANLADVNKNFNKPAEYSAVLNRLRSRAFTRSHLSSSVWTMTASGVAARTLREIESWPPGLPIFGQLTPFPSTPLYQRLVKAGRLTRPKHWLDFAPFQMAHTPLKMSIAETHDELNQAWEGPTARKKCARDRLDRDKPIDHRVMHLITD
jgi:hypothetical protein